MTMPMMKSDSSDDSNGHANPNDSLVDDDDPNYNKHWNNSDNDSHNTISDKYFRIDISSDNDANSRVNCDEADWN